MFAAVPRVAPSPAQTNVNTPQLWQRVVATSDSFLAATSRQLADQVEEFEPELASAAREALTNQGKQLRPLLLALAAEATGGVRPEHVTAAVIVEMVHLATLVHDDVMDEAQIRRRRQTVASRWGNERAVLLGDCLFAQALKLAASYPTPEVCRAVASATKTVCTGEILQNEQRLRFDLPREEYVRVLEMKTAELFSLSCELGAFLNESPRPARLSLRSYGLALGTAYQVYDDCLDVFGSESAAGKSLGTDLSHGKLTLPILLLRESAAPEDWDGVVKLLRNWEPKSHATVLAMLRKHHALERSLAVLHTYTDHARAVVAPLGTQAEHLLLLTDFLIFQAASLGTAGLH